jgi:hypothetical protein
MGKDQRPRALSWLPAGGAGAAALAIYLACLAPGLTFAHHGTDGGDLIAAARCLGVPHPSGYPTYTLLAWMFSQIPLGTIAWRVNLLSAVCAALSAGLLCRIAQEVQAPGPWPQFRALITALTLATAPLLWSGR